jgi:translation elongation factor EF-G
MKIKKSKLKQLIKEEIEAILSEDMPSADVYLEKIKGVNGESILADLQNIAMNDPDTMANMPKNVTPQGAEEVLRAIAATLGAPTENIESMYSGILDATEPDRAAAQKAREEKWAHIR